jgi:hypothetical protein
MEPPGATVFRRSLVICAAFALVACAGPPGSTPSGVSSPSPGATEAVGSRSAGATSAPGLFRLVGAEPVIARATFEGRGAVLPAAITRAEDGTYHAWVIAFAELPGIQELHHLASADAIAWTEREDPSLEALSEGLGNPGALPGSVLETGSGWVMYYVGTPATEREAWEIRRATAPGPDGPWTPGGPPVVTRGPAGAWDAGGLDFPAVFAADDGFAMLYSGIDPADREGGWIGLATSSDGIAWTKRPEPVVAPGLCGAFDSRAIQQPRAIVDGDRLILAYAGYHGTRDTRAQVGLAESRDLGRTWRCLWPSNALDPDGLPAGGFVHTLTAFRRGDRPALLLEWLAGQGTDVWLAEAAEFP